MVMVSWCQPFMGLPEVLLQEGTAGLGAAPENYLASQVPRRNPSAEHQVLGWIQSRHRALGEELPPAQPPPQYRPAAALRWV